MSGTLFIVATPIGNLGDITLRALETLKRVDRIACEDTRVTSKLLRHYGIDKPLVAFHRHSRDVAPVVDALRRGEDVAYVTDAGTPGLSDPATDLVAAASKVVAIPGPSALAAAWSVAGVGDGEFHFAGFLSSSPKKRRARLRELAAEGVPVVLYVAPHKLEKTLADIDKILGDREVVVLRELTKVHEEIARGRARDLRVTAKGEIVLIVTARPPAR